MAHKKGVGSSRNGRNSNPQYLGVKHFGGERVTAGSILVKQRGTRFHVGNNVFKAKDDSLHSYIDGVVKFEDHGDRGRCGEDRRTPASGADGSGPRGDGESQRARRGEENAGAAEQPPEVVRDDVRVLAWRLVQEPGRRMLLQ